MSRSPVSVTTCLRGRCERKSARTAVAGPVGGGRLAQRSQELVPGGEHRAASARGSVLYDLLLAGLPLVGPVPPLVLVPLRARGVGGASSIRIVTSGDIDGSASYLEWSPDSEDPKTSSVDGLPVRGTLVWVSLGLENRFADEGSHQLELTFAEPIAG